MTAAPATRSLGRNIAAASLVMIGLRLSFRLLGLVSSFVLVRLLLPSDFGLVGLAMSVASALEMLTETSFGLALIRLPSVTRAHLDTAWTFGVVRGSLIGGLLLATSGVAARWIGEPRVGPIMWVIAGAAFLQGFENIGVVEYRRGLQFGRIFESRLYAKLFGLAVMLPAAALTHSYWSLVAGTVSLRLFQVAYTYRQHPYRPRLSLAAGPELFHFSKWLLVSNILYVIESTVPVMLFSRVAGARGVGLFQVAYQVATLPGSEIAAPIREPIYSGYAKLLDDVPQLRQHFVEGFGVLLLVVGPMSVGIALTGHLVTPLAFGPQWEEAASLIAPCAILGLLDVIAQYPHNLFMALNRQRSFVIIYGIMLAIRYPLFVAATIGWGIAAGVHVLAAGAGLTAVTWTAAAMSMLALQLRELLTPVWRTAAATAVMAACLLGFADLAPGASGAGAALAHLGVVVASGAAVQFGVQWLLWRLCGEPEGPETKLAGLARAALLAVLARRRAAAG